MSHAAYMPDGDLLPLAAAGDEPALAARLERFLDAPASEFTDAATAGGFVPGAEAMQARLASLLSPRPTSGGTA